MKILIGLVSGGVAAVIASLVALVLDSPDDAVFNTATVSIGALVMGLVAALLWAAVKDRPNGAVLYFGVLAVAYAALAGAAVAGEPELERLATYVTSLAAIVFAVVALLTPVLAGLELPPLAAYGAPLAAAAGAFALGMTLTLVDDDPSGELSLPDPSTSPTPGAVVTAADVAGVTYEVVPGESELTYTVREKQSLLPTSNDAVGRTSGLTGTVHLDGQPSEISADMSTLESDQNRRDNYVQENIFNTDPIVVFEVDDLGALPDPYTPGTEVPQTLAGRATVRGVERELTFEVQARLDGETLQVHGQTDFTWDDFEITPPNTPFVDVEDNVHIEVLIIARPAA